MRRRNAIPKSMTAVFAMLAGTMLAGCGTLVERDGERMWCSDQSANVINTPAQLKVTKNPIRVCPGFTVTLTLRQAAAAQTRPKTANAPWLMAGNSSPSVITINVPEGTPLGDYDYELVVTGTGMLDPRIVVE